jgi:hypothetical protein
MSLNPRKRLAAALDWRVQEAMLPIRADIDRLRGEVSGVHADIAAIHEGLGENVAFMRSEFDRLLPHVASLETRLADLADGRLLSAGDAGRGLEEERIRIQLQAVSHYEERLRRIEAALQTAALPAAAE